MSFFNILYSVVIGPLELFFEILYYFTCKLAANAGFSIVFLSLVMNLLLLPLYKRADAIQDEQREIEARMKPGVAHIKKTFHGDERFMMLQTFYRQNHYKPGSVLKGSVSLLLEIPFFMAAYNFLSHLELLQGASFGPIADLGKPDGLLVIGSLTIHLLPILMTAINLISSAIYTKGLPARSKIQLYVMASLFLVLLYSSPSGLVFYWTLNNLFSLVKNLLVKMKHRDRLLAGLKKYAPYVLSAIGVFATFAIFFIWVIPAIALRLTVALLLLSLQIPLGLRLFGKVPKKPRDLTVTRKDGFLFLAGCLFLAILTGILIPTAVLAASPEEFIDLETHRSPLLYLIPSVSLAFGTYVLWFGIFYLLARPAGKKAMGLGIWILSAAAVINYMFFGTDYGNLSAVLKYDITPSFATRDQVIDILLILSVSVLLTLIWVKRRELVKIAYTALSLTLVVMSVVNVVKIQAVTSDAVESITPSAQVMPEFTLSKKGKNVVVLMMDRAISGYVPYMMNERPELKEKFAGFTYFPNTISYGGSTNFGSPALFGGYEYTPAEMNKRDTESLASKQNEALKVMPVIFDQEHYAVTVCDPSYAGYGWIPDLSIYDEYPNIQKYLTAGKFTLEGMEVSPADALNRNFFCYSLFRTAPVILQQPFYANGTYSKLGGTGSQVRSGLFQASGISPTFANAYAVLENLSSMTRISDTAENAFFMISNDATHSPMLLQAPDYMPSHSVDNREYENAHAGRFTLGGRTLKMETGAQVMHYHVNMSSMIQLGKWFDYLRANDLYDNTRIIIVADHGYYLDQFDDMHFENVDLMRFNPLLMVKDFNSREFTTDNRFMTNADVPTIATHGLVENPINPFTRKPITSDAKAGRQPIILSREWDTSLNNGNTFMDSAWVSVHDNIFDLSNWEKVK